LKVLFDECTPKPLKHALGPHYVITAQQLGWAGMRNGTLLSAAEGEEFDVVVTCDKNMFHQQEIADRPLAVVELPSNRLGELLLLSRVIRDTITAAKPGNYYRITTNS
jgi:hypothetical protein